MDSKDEWAGRSKRFFKAELKRRDVTYEELARRLSEMGMDESEGSVAMKINRGAFPTWFFLASMKAIGCPAVRVEDL
ncbi:hypothetical protein VY88_17575 [Azospirillum thiophilum]|uniref:DUF6471 domain-containing protein n=1 Tax=Azospirillum thiophilum TaxID=528244 RepID=A0AAC8W0B8_9PROT|nr:DUF6471 domain-containing protein [Azospirillum thiophilum]ALG72560.1 hypothetical protein AL072_15940 [Azospirillum thiophilum]KJR64524.1 hypothetical protein VY88_17575 [Azospirillum thiophilum]